MNKIKHIIKKIFLIIIVIQANIGADTLANFYKDKWEFLRYKFIISPEKQIKDLQPLLKRSFLSTISAFISMRIGHKLTSLTQDQFFNTPFYSHYINKAPISQLIEPGIGISTTVIGTFIAHKIIKEKQLLNIQSESLRNFLDNWMENENNCPEELRSAFIDVYNHYINNNHAFKKEEVEIIRSIVSRINDHFGIKENNGELFKLQDFFQLKFLGINISADIGSILHGIAEIIKSLKQGVIN